MIQGGSPDRSYKWLVVGMLWFVCFFNYADRQAIFSVFPLIKQQLALTDVQLGVVGAAFMWMYAQDAGPGRPDRLVSGHSPDGGLSYLR
jgi:hypothetical protein